MRNLFQGCLYLFPARESLAIERSRQGTRKFLTFLTVQSQRKQCMKESVSGDAFGAEFAGMAAERVDDSLVAVHSDGR